MRVAGDLAERQHGQVGRAQLLRLGFTAGTVDEAVRARLLRPEHAGAYAVGHRASTPDGRRMAAVLALDEVGVLSAWTAGEVWRAVDEDAARRIDLLVADGVHRERPRLRIRRSQTLGPQDVTTIRGLAVLRPARMAVDLAAVAPRPVALRALDRLLVGGRCSPAALRRTTDRLRHQPGRRLVVGYLDTRRATALRLRSELERLVAELLLGSDLPAPLFNPLVAVEGEVLEVDVAWPGQRLVLEADGRAYHEGVVAELEDARREALLRAAGWRVVRVTWWDVHREPGRLLDRVRRKLRVHLVADRR
ncbi:MAG TPA: DUF559 domain-containing protein [Baekduia sp.]|nr:DUF559 domain-containing protein [Baekduia sp.]